eukprot:scaffold158722_cov19-Tisochrysis_lutea.AAC.3
MSAHRRKSLQNGAQPAKLVVCPLHACSWLMLIAPACLAEKYMHAVGCKLRISPRQETHLYSTDTMGLACPWHTMGVLLFVEAMVVWCVMGGWGDPASAIDAEELDWQIVDDVVWSSPITVAGGRPGLPDNWQPTLCPREEQPDVDEHISHGTRLGLSQHREQHFEADGRHQQSTTGLLRPYKFAHVEVQVLSGPTSVH